MEQQKSNIEELYQKLQLENAPVSTSVYLSRSSQENIDLFQKTGLLESFVHNDHRSLLFECTISSEEWVLSHDFKEVTITTTAHKIIYSIGKSNIIGKSNSDSFPKGTCRGTSDTNMELDTIEFYSKYLTGSIDRVNNVSCSNFYSKCSISSPYSFCQKCHGNYKKDINALIKMITFPKKFSDIEKDSIVAILSMKDTAKDTTRTVKITPENVNEYSTKCDQYLKPIDDFHNQFSDIVKKINSSTKNLPCNIDLMKKFSTSLKNKTEQSRLENDLKTLTAEINDSKEKTSKKESDLEEIKKKIASLTI